MGNQRKRNKTTGSRRLTQTIWVPLLAVILGIQVYGASNDAKDISVSQAFGYLPTVVAYVDILDSQGKGVEGVTENKLSAALGEHKAEVQTLKPFRETGEGTAYIVLVDISKTLTEKEFKQIREALTLWVDRMNENDRMSIIAFGNECKELIDFTNDKETLKDKVKELKATDRLTKLHEALQKALQMTQLFDPNLPTRRVVVVLSDGKDEGSGIAPGYLKDEIIEKYHLPIYSIGYSRLPTREKRKYLDILKSFSNRSGGFYIEAVESNLQQIYERIQEAILRVYRVELCCKSCIADNRSHELKILLSSDSWVSSDEMNLPLLENAPSRECVVIVERSEDEKIPLWALIAGGGISLLFIILIVALLLKRKKLSIPDKKETEVLAGEEEEHVTGESQEATGGGVEEGPKIGGLNIRLVEIGSKGKTGDYEIILAKRAVVGRKPGCDVVLEDDMDISREHFELIFEDRSVLIRDLDTTNGTLVNGVPTTNYHQLESNDIIQVGRTQLRIIFEREKT